MVQKIAYIISRFPTITETFVLYEMLELERLGMEIEVFSLIHEREEALQPGAEVFTERVHYPTLSWELISAQFYWLFKKPKAYLGTWFTSIKENFKSPKFLSRAVAAVPMGALFARQIKAFGAEHLHAHFASHPTLVAYVVHRLTGISYSLTAHAHDIYVERAMLEEKLQHSRLIVTISEFNQRLLQQLYGDSISRKTSVIHCGIDNKLFQARSDKAPGDVFTIACVGSLRDYKGQMYLVKACALLAAEKIPFQCYFAGDGADRPDLEAEIQNLGLQNTVHILGYQTLDKVRDLLNKADVFVLPSVVTASGKMEGIPVALMEALAMSIPVITTQISGIPELVIHNETGLLVPERDATALKDALIKLHKNPQLGQSLAVRGREHVIEEFDLQKNAQKLYQTFSALA
jgi:colanic acid/amylovoran biosynthesis glycosyltransferase